MFTNHEHARMIRAQAGDLAVSLLVGSYRHMNASGAWPRDVQVIGDSAAATIWIGGALTVNATAKGAGLDEGIEVARRWLSLWPHFEASAITTITFSMSPVTARVVADALNRAGIDTPPPVDHIGIAVDVAPRLYEAGELVRIVKLLAGDSMLWSRAPPRIMDLLLKPIHRIPRGRPLEAAVYDVGRITSEKEMTRSTLRLVADPFSWDPRDEAVIEDTSSDVLVGSRAAVLMRRTLPRLPVADALRRYTIYLNAL